MKLSELLSMTVSPDPEILRVTSRSSEIDGKTLFFLLPGVFHETAKYLPFCLAKHPAAIVLDRDADTGDIPKILSNDPRALLSSAALKLSGTEPEKLRFFGITGTNGKTTTARMLEHILCQSGEKVGAFETGRIASDGRELEEEYYSMTTPDPEIFYPALKRMQDDGCGAVVAEVSSHAIALGKVAPLRFSEAAFLGLCEEHLDFHKTMEDYFETKAKLFSQADAAFVNADDPHGRRLLKRLPNAVSFGAVYDADVRATEIEDLGFSGVRFSIKDDGEEILTIKTPGVVNVYNALAAYAMATRAGIPKETVLPALADFPGVRGRFEVLRGAPTVILDYAHTSLALDNLLKTVISNINAGQKLFLVFGCGGERDKTKRPVFAKIAEDRGAFSIVTSDNSRGESPTAIIRDILEGFRDPASHVVISDRRRAIEEAILTAGDDDIVVIAGKGHETYIVDGRGIRDFDERKIVADARKKRQRRA